jgi:ribosomal protein L22
MIPRAKGSSSPIRKRFVTLKIVLSDDKDQKKKDLAETKARIVKRNQSAKAKKPAAETSPVKNAVTPRVKLASKGESK